MEAGAEIKVATITLWNFAALLINVIAFGIMYMKGNKNKKLKLFFVVQLAMFIWLLGKVLKTVSPIVEMRWFFIVFYYFGICLLEASFIDFSYTYYKDEYLKSKWRIGIYFLALCQFLIVVTNPYHYLFYSRFSFWGDGFGPVFYVHVVINYALIIIGMILCSIRFKEHIKEKTRFRRNLINIAILTPVLFNFVYITKILHALFRYLGIQVFDITPIVYTWSLLVFIYVTFKYEFFDLSPIMKHEISKKLELPIIIVDSNNKVLYKNSEFENAFTCEEDIVGQLVHNDLDNLVICKENKYRYSVDLHESLEGKKYIIGFTNVTAYELAKKALATENKDLSYSNKKLEGQIEMLKQSSLVGARNYIARELHDILGHSLVVTIKLLEVSKMYYRVNKDSAKDSLDKARLSIKDGFEEMKAIRLKDCTKIYNTLALEKEMRSMLKVLDVSGVDVKLYMRCPKVNLDDKVYDTIKRVLTEIVTNTLKHSKASKLLMTVSIKDNHINVQAMDNGKGVKNLVKGNGLNGIDGRLSLVGGKAKYKSEKEEGFLTNIVIPI